MTNKLIAALLCAISISVSVPAKSDNQPAKPNILFIAVDDLAPILGSYGDKKAITPNIDHLASSGVLFKKAYAQFPVCGPSRASLLTSMRPESNGVTDLKLKLREVRDNVLTLPEHFKNNGYETVGVGKIFDPRNVEGRSKDDPKSWSIKFKQVKGEVGRGKEKFAVESIDANEEKFTDAVIAQRGVRLIENLSQKDKPFFVAVGFKKPHLPFVAPKKYFDLYQRESFAINPLQQAPVDSEAKYILNDNNELLSNYKPTPKRGEKPKVYGKGSLLTKAQQQELLHGYYAATSFIDAQVGELLHALEQGGKAKNTIVVLWGDHGFHLGDHGLWGKHTTMEKANRVPLLIKMPNGKPAVTDSLAELMDIFPTLTELASIETPKHLEGRSLVPVLNNPVKEVRDFAISQYKRSGAFGYSLRTANFRYTEWLNQSGEVAYRDLYDMKNDPEETINVALDPRFTSELLKHEQLLRKNKYGLTRLK